MGKEKLNIMININHGRRYQFFTMLGNMVTKEEKKINKLY